MVVQKADTGESVDAPGLLTGIDDTRPSLASSQALGQSASLLLTFSEPVVAAGFAVTADDLDFGAGRR